MLKPSLERKLESLPELAVWILPFFVLCLVALNGWRLEEWGTEGFRVWFSHTIMQTTLFDFSFVLLVVSYFIHIDAKKHGLTWWWIVPTYPFMPTLGLLAYLIVRQRKIAGRS